MISKHEPCEGKLANILASLDNLPQAELPRAIVEALDEMARMLDDQAKQIRYLAEQQNAHEGLKAEDAHGGLTESPAEKDRTLHELGEPVTLIGAADHTEEV